MDKQKAKEIIDVLLEVMDKTKEALSELGMPANMIELNTNFHPDFEKLLPEEVITLFREFRLEMVLYLNRRGFSQREISRRMGGSSQKTVNKVLKESKK